MKRILVVLLMLIGFSFAAEAQISSGSFMVGGTAGFDLEPTKIELTPRVGYFIIDNLAVGATVGLEYLKVEDESNTDITVSPFVRYYLNNGLFAQGDVSFERDAGLEDWRFRLSIGYSYELTENVRIEPLLPISIDPFSIGVGVGVQAYIFR